MRNLVFEKPGILSEQLKTLTSSKYHRIQYFLLKLRTGFLLTKVYKRVFGIILFCLDLDLFVKIKKDLVSTHSFGWFLLITQDLSKIKKNLEHDFVDIVKQKTCVKFQQKVLNFAVVGARQSSQFFRQIAWFLGNNRALSKFRYRIFHNLISITKL